ncbi:hypothetical protein LTR91_010072 [Friedmanniomyces endolithicus]|uniref:AB hydrolase-1 domain-containing protein n=1 Tax=Friedmanniomyces endolithicus TaxID=329885 RepID=A0AAN6QT49_9PEZI|nr:hypothetical protein LTR91_010072 [Friedmanniomyces endolithicus]KAK1034922.1 hypothetical protein LTS16_015002 [Friedmanniomyces endolithicus]
MPPTIIIVPGAWHFGTKHYKPLTDRLETAGYKVIPLDLPSVSDNPPLTGWKDDITHIAQTIEQAADRGEDVVLVMHSRGGHCGSDAAQGLSKTDRQQAGKKGGIVRCVFMCAFAAPEGLSVFFATNGPDEWIDVKHTVCSPTRVEEIFYNDCTPEQIEAAKRDIRPQSTLCFLLPLTYAAWKHIPSTYLVCEKDMGIPVVAQEAMILQPGADFTVERCGASHSPFLSMPDFTAEVVRRAAGEKSVRARRGAIEGLTVSKLQMCNVKSTRPSTKRISVILDGYLKTAMTPNLANADPLIR